MDKAISHDRKEESAEAKARWFQSLPLSERMEMLCSFTELAEDKENAEPAGEPEGK
ncbi:MAG: hypothetical protein ABIL62_00755 [Planctomycetota bacterium]